MFSEGSCSTILVVLLIVCSRPRDGQHSVPHLGSSRFLFATTLPCSLYCICFSPYSTVFPAMLRCFVHRFGSPSIYLILASSMFILASAATQGFTHVHLSRRCHALCLRDFVASHGGTTQPARGTILLVIVMVSILRPVLVHLGSYLPPPCSHFGCFVFLCSSSEVVLAHPSFGFIIHVHRSRRVPRAS